MSKIVTLPIYSPYSLNDAINWKRRVLKEQAKRRGAIPYSLGASIDWKRCRIREQKKRLAASNL